MGERIAVLGSGSWGCTLAALLANQGHTLTVWGHAAEEIDRVRAERHPPGVPELRLPEMRLTTDLAEAVAGCGTVVLAVPSQAVRASAKLLAAICPDLPAVVIASKGIDLETLQPLSEVVRHFLPRTAIAVVSGPCIAREVARGIPTSVVAACTDEAVARQVQEWFSSPTFRVYRQTDVLGVELAGAYKNVIAIAAGVCDGLGFGANSKSALLTRGLAEMRRFALAMGASDLTIMGLAGLGDLCVTCFSPYSRNRRFGEAIGRGALPAEVIANMGEVVEGAPTAEAVVRMAEDKEIVLPIANTVVRIISGEWTPSEAVNKLMMRELKSEF